MSIEGKVECNTGGLEGLSKRMDEQKPLTYKDLEDTLKDIFNRHTPEPFVMYTGYQGMRTFDLTMMLHVAGVNGWFTTRYFWGTTARCRNHSFDELRFKHKPRLPFIELSLIEKAGMFKLRFYSKQTLSLHLYKGTNLITQTNNFEDLNKYLK